MLGDPMSPRGAIHWGLLGFGAAAVALLAAMFFPKIIPARATQVKL